LVAILNMIDSLDPNQSNPVGLASLAADLGRYIVKQRVSSDIGIFCGKEGVF